MSDENKFKVKYCRSCAKYKPLEDKWIIKKAKPRNYVICELCANSIKPPHKS